MLQAIQIMFMAVAISIVTGFLISLLIQVLCRVVAALGASGQQEDDGAATALAIALALNQEKAGK